MFATLKMFANMVQLHNIFCHFSYPSSSVCYTPILPFFSTCQNLSAAFLFRMLYAYIPRKIFMGCKIQNIVAIDIHRYIPRKIFMGCTITLFLAARYAAASEIVTAKMKIAMHSNSSMRYSISLRKNREVDM